MSARPAPQLGFCRGKAGGNPPIAWIASLSGSVWFPRPSAGARRLSASLIVIPDVACLRCDNVGLAAFPFSHAALTALCAPVAHMVLKYRKQEGSRQPEQDHAVKRLERAHQPPVFFEDEIVVAIGRHGVEREQH